MLEQHRGLLRNIIVFVRRMFTLPKTLLLLLFAGIVIGAVIVFGLFVDVLRGRAEELLTNWTLTFLHGKTAQTIAAWAISAAIHYPIASRLRKKPNSQWISW